MEGLTLLLLEDDVENNRVVAQLAEELGYSVIPAHNVPDALAKCRSRKDFTVVIVDLQVGADDPHFMAGWDFLQQAQLASETHVVIFTAHPDPGKLPEQPPTNISVSYRFLRKGGGVGPLLKILTERAEHHRAKQTGGIIRESAEDVERQADLPMIAASGLPVLITGDTGCGKEHIAQDLAQMALPQSEHHRIHTVNCATLTETFTIATLLGYAPGAYTGARREGNDGILRRITGTIPEGLGDNPPLQNADLPGILILDELAELPPFVQAQLLRVLQGQRVNPLGDTGEGYTPVIRIIACTNDEKKLAKPKRFRQDLLGRLDGWHITIGPPHKRKATFLRAARIEALSFSMTVEFGRPPVKISDVAEDVDAEVATKLVPASEGGLRFGFRELKGWIGRACAIALYRAKNDTQLTAADLRLAWDKRMKLDDTEKSESTDREVARMPPPPDKKVLEVREHIEGILRKAGKPPPHPGWDEHHLRPIAAQLATENPTAYSELVAAKKEYTKNQSRQRLLYIALNGEDTNEEELKKFVDRLRTFLRTKKPN